MAKKVGKYQIPFDSKTDSLLTYVSNWTREVVDWQDNHSFEDTIEFFTFERGRSAAHAIFRRPNSNYIKLTVFLTDFEEMIPKMVNGKITGKFTYVKRGQNYGCTIDHSGA